MATKIKKAKPEQAYLKVAVYGPSGSGKTFSSLLWAEGLAKKEGKKILLVDTERGADFYGMKIPARKVHPEAFSFDVLHTMSMKETLDELLELDTSEYGVVVVDSITHLWEAIQNAVPDEDRAKNGSIPLHLWAGIKKPYKNLLRFLLDCEMHVFVLGREKNVFEEEDGQLKQVGKTMRAEGETPYEFHICIRQESRKAKNNSASSTILSIIEKDRTGILATQTIPNPTYKTIEPVVSILNGTQAKTPSVDEVAEIDQELLDRNSKDKVAKSEEKYKEFSDSISKAKSPQELNAVGDKIGKSRVLVEGDKKLLRGLYEKKLNKLNELVK